jgi:glucose-1-phosphate cytidylyltransferase
MKTIIFAGGLSTRMTGINENKPKPLLNIGGQPMISHVIDIFTKYGLKDFIILTGYKSDQIKYYFKSHKKKYSNLNINFLFTGVKTLTGKRLFLAKDLIKEDFFLTYSDGLCNINLKKLYDFHKKFKKCSTITAVRPPARFGELFLLGKNVKLFKEKEQLNSGWINGGFFVLREDFFKFIPDKDVMFEREPVNNAIKANQMIAYKHNSFWQCIDTKKDLEALKKYMVNNQTPWLD